MSKIVIGIHGMGNKPKASQLEKWWKAAIREGFNGLNCFRYVRFELVYWASILYKIPYISTVIDPDHPQFLKEPYIKGLPLSETSPRNHFLLKLRQTVNKQLDHIFIEEDGSPQLNSLSDFIIKHFAKDLDIYYSSHWRIESSERHRICSSLAQKIERHKRKKICS